MSRACFWRGIAPCYRPVSQRRLALNSGVESMRGRVKLAQFACRLSLLACFRRRLRAAAGDRRAAGSLQHEAGWNQRSAGAQRLSADHPSSGRPLDRLYRPSRRHRRHSGAGQSADRQGRAERHLDRRRHRSRAARNICVTFRARKANTKRGGAQMVRICDGKASAEGRSAARSTCCAPSAARRTRSGTSPIPPIRS